MPRGSKPGERRGGRQKGSVNKTTAVRAQAIRMAGITPKDFLLNGLAFYHGQITDEQAKKEPDEGKIAAAFSAGKEFAKDAAPYCHSRYGTIEGDRRAPQQQEPAPTDARAPTGDSNVDEIVTRFNTALKPAANGAVKH